jgi:GNAT superfamily N-acetyltransferase
MVEFHDERLDGDAGRELLGAFEAEVAALYPGWTPTSGPTAAPEEFVAPAGLFLVGYDGDSPVTCGGFKRLSTSDVEVKRLYVAPEARGTGLAGVLLDTLESRARDVGYERVRLDTGDDQPTALRLYRTRGYVEIDDYNANPFASHWFEKIL